MIKKISFLFLIITYALNSYSQDLSFGLKSGLNICDVIETTSNIITPSKVRYHIELFCNYEISKLFQIQIEPGFIEKGSWTSRYKDRSSKYGYVTFPTIIILKPLKKVNFEIGSEYSFLVYSKKKDAKGNISDADFIDYYNHFEISGIAGMSYNFLKNNQIGIRFARGFSPIYKNTSFLDNGSYKYYNRYFEAFIRIAFLQFNR